MSDLVNAKPWRILSDQASDELAAVLALRTHQGEVCLHLALRGVQLIDTKQLDYGPNNILATGEIGCAVRAQDKVSRLLHLLQKSEAPKNESLEDSWVDLGNYATIARAVRAGLWTPKP